MNIFWRFLLYINRQLEHLAKVHFKLRYTGYRKKYKLHPKFRFNGWYISIYGDGDFQAGEKSYIGRHSSIELAEGCKVSIGKHSSLSHFISIYTSNHKADKDFSSGDNSMRTGDVEIGDYCWIGIKSTIIGPVKIGDNSVIAANSLINRDLPPHSIAIGVPAQVVKFKSYVPLDKQIELASQYRSVLSPMLLEKLEL